MWRGHRPNFTDFIFWVVGFDAPRDTKSTETNVCVCVFCGLLWTSVCGWQARRGSNGLMFSLTAKACRAYYPWSCQESPCAYRLGPSFLCNSASNKTIRDYRTCRLAQKHETTRRFVFQTKASKGETIAGLTALRAAASLT